MRLRHLFFIAVALCAFSPSASQAGVAGTLIKASGPSVYYVSQDQKRYTFPTEATYKTWYEDFSTVQTVSDQALASYPLTANATYRPGTRLVKITTDPKVYAVARGSILRWIQTEAVARALYGDTWSQQIDDIPDSFFVNYRVGAPITSVTDYNRAEERSYAPSIEANKLPAPTILPPSPLPQPAAPTPIAPTPLPTPSAFTISLQTSTPTPHYGETFTLRTEAGPSANVLRTKIYVDATELRVCEYYICSSDIYIPITDTQNLHEIRVEVYGANNVMSSSTLRISANSEGSPYTNLIVRHADVEPNGNREITAQAINNFIARNIDIYIDGNLANSCTSQQECRFITQETSPLGTVHTIFMVATDQNGATVRSETKTITVVANDSPVIDITTDKNALYTTERMNVTITANDDDGIQQTRILLDGAVIQTCALSTCTVSIGPWAQPRTLQIIGSATDLLGAHSSTTSATISIQAP